MLVGHGVDPMQEIGRKYRVRVVKDGGHLQLFVDAQFAHGIIDRDTLRYPIPDYGKFGFRLIGSDVMADVGNLAVYRVEHQESVNKIARWETVDAATQNRLLETGKTVPEIRISKPE